MRAALILLILVAFLLEFNLVYFSVWANLLGFAWLVPLTIAGGKRNITSLLSGFVGGAVVTYLLVVLLVYTLLLGGGATWISAVIYHYVVPLGIAYVWFAIPNGASYRWWYPLAWLVGPLIYFTAILWRGIETGVYPYFFVDLPRLGAAGLAGWVLLICLFFSLVGYAVVWLRNTRLTILRGENQESNS